MSLSKNSSNQQDVFNKIINYDLDNEQNLIRSKDDYSLIENKQNWGTHAQSWMDENVKTPIVVNKFYMKTWFLLLMIHF